MKKSRIFKKAQLTIFIIIGILLLLVAILFISYNASKETTTPIDKKIQLPYDFQPIYNHIEDCVRKEALGSLNILGIQGGYITLPENHLATEYSNIGYSYFDGYSTLTSINDMEISLEKFIRDVLPTCVNLSLFSGFEFRNDNISSNVEILENEVVFDVSYGLQASKDDITHEFKDFSVNMPVRLGHIYSVLSGIVEKTLNDPDWIDMTYLSEFDLKINILPNSDNTLVYSLTDSTGLEDYVYLSAFSYKINNAPLINIPDVIYLDDSKPFLLEVDVTDPESNQFECSDDSAMFDISSDCVILFVPEVPGEYNVTIAAEDIRGNIAEKNVLFIVKED